MSDDYLTRCLWKGVADTEQQQEALIEELEEMLAEYILFWQAYELREELEARAHNMTERIEEIVAKNCQLEAKLEKAVESLTVIDALDPEGMINGCSQSAIIGLVSRMGAIARATLEEIKGQNDD